MANESDYAGTDLDGFAYRDTGNASQPTPRVHTDVDIHVLLNFTEPDPGRADKTLKILAPRRSTNQTR